MCVSRRECFNCQSHDRGASSRTEPQRAYLGSLLARSLRRSTTMRTLSIRWIVMLGLLGVVRPRVAARVDSPPPPSCCSHGPGVVDLDLAVSRADLKVRQRGDGLRKLMTEHVAFQGERSAV